MNLNLFTDEDKSRIYKVLNGDCVELDYLINKFNKYPNINKELVAYLSLYKAKNLADTYSEKGNAKCFFENRIEELINLNNIEYQKIQLYQQYAKEKKALFLLWLSKVIKIKKLQKRILEKTTQYRLISTNKAYAKFLDEVENDKDKSIRYYRCCAYLGDVESIDILIEYYQQKKDKQLVKEMLQCGIEENNSYFDKFIDFVIKHNDYDGGKILYTKLITQIKYDFSVSSYLAKLYEQGIYVERNLLFAFLLYSINKEEKYNDKRELLKAKILKDTSDAYKEEENKLILKQKEQEEKERLVLIRKQQEEKDKKRDWQNEQKELKNNKQILSKYLDSTTIIITQNLILDPNEEDEMGRKRGEGKREYNHKLTLYRHALNELNQNKKIEKTIKAAESGHTKAMMSLYEYYKVEDKESAYKWLRLAVDNKNKKAIEIYKDVKKEEKVFKKKQKEEYLLRTKEIRDLLSKNTKDLKAILELVIENDENAISLIERCYKYVALSKEEEKVFSTYASNDYINYLIALSYKEIDKEKYVTLITRLYDKTKMSELTNEFNENKSYIFDDAKTRKIVEDIARSSTNVYIKKLVVSCQQKSNSESIEFLYMLCENKNRKAVKSVIEYYIENNINIDNKYIETIMSYDGLDKNNDYETIINFAIAKLYKYNFINDRKNLSPNEVTLMLEKAAKLENEPIIKKDAIYELVDCYINGYGVEKNLLKASQYLEKYDPAKAKDLMYKHNFLKGEEKVRNFFEKYKCKEFDDFCVINKEKADKIIRRYINFNDESIINTLKRRDYLLSIGLTIDEIFDETGYLSEIKIASKVKKIEDEIRRKKEEEIGIEQERNKKELERLEKERITKLKVEQERLEQIRRQNILKQSEKVEQGKTSTVINNNISSKHVQNITFPMPYKNSMSEELYGKYLKDLLPSSCGRIVHDECVKIAKLRAEYNYPFRPSVAGISQRKYNKLHEEYLLDVEKYTERLYAIDNPIKGKENAYRMKVYQYPDCANFINLSEFYEKVKLKTSEIHSFKTGQVKIADREQTISSLPQVERMLCLLPLYAREVVVDVYVQMHYKTVSSHEYLEWAEAFDNSEYSKIMNWGEFSSTKSGYHGDIYLAGLKDSNAQSNANARADINMQKALTYLILEEFKKYKIFYRHTYTKNGKTAYIEALVNKLTLKFHFYEK